MWTTRLSACADGARPGSMAFDEPAGLSTTRIGGTGLPGHASL